MLSKTTCFCLLSALLLVDHAHAQPKERMRVKYRIKSGGGKRVIDKTVAEAVLVPEERVSSLVNNEVNVEGRENQFSAYEEKKENGIEDLTTEEIMETVAGMGDELQVGLKGMLGDYGVAVASITEGITRAARSNQRSVGDIVFDVVKEVVAEVVGGVLTRAFGIGTARSGSGGSSGLIEIVLSAISNAGQGKSCAK